MSTEFMISIYFLWSKVERAQGVFVLGNRPLKPAYLVWMFLGYVVTKSGQVNVVLAVILSAHTFYFFSKVYPQLPSSKGRKPLAPPRMLERVCQGLGLNNQAPFNVPDFDD